MGRFAARAITRDGRLVREEVEAADAAAARALLEARGLTVLELKARRPGLLAGGWWRPGGSARGRAERLRELAVLLQAGERLDAALVAVAEGARGAERRALLEVAERLRRGLAPHRAFAAAPLFDPAFRALVEAGERAGRLPQVLAHAAELAERQEGWRERVQGALVYPMVLLVGTVASLAFVFGWVVPRLSGLFSGREEVLPAASRALFALARLVEAQGPTLALGLVLLLLTGLLAARRLRPHLGALLLRLPVVGPLWRDRASAEYARTLALLLEGGLELPRALALARGAVAEPHVRARLARVEEAVARGEGLARGLRAAAVLDPLAVRLLEVGEGSGRLAETARRAAERLEARFVARTERLLRLLEPALVLLAASAVGFVVVAVVGALVSLGDIRSR